MNRAEQYCQTIKRMSQNNDIDIWNSIVETIDYNSDKQYTETVTTIPFQFNYSGFSVVFGRLAANGSIYCVPCGESRVIKLDPSTDTCETLATFSTASNKWFVPSFTQINNCIYAFPAAQTSVLKINTNNDNVETFGSFTSSVDYLSCRTNLNGFVYAIPSQNRYVAKLNPHDDSITYIDTGNTGANKWSYGALSPNGSIFGIPRECNYMLCINPDDTIDNISGSFGSGQYKLSSGRCTADNMLYLTGDAVASLSYNLDTKVLTGIGKTNMGECVLAPNGVLYCTGSKTFGIFRYDTIRKTWLSTLQCNGYYNSIVLANNNAIYAFPCNGTNNNILKIQLNINGGKDFIKSALLSPFIN